MSYDCFSCANLINEFTKTKNGNYLYKCKARTNTCGFVRTLNDLKYQGCSGYEEKQAIVEESLFEVNK